MANITVPSSFEITSTEGPVLDYEAQAVFASRYGGAPTVFTPAEGRWRGRITLKRLGQASRDSARAIETFLAELKGSANTFFVPINKPPKATKSGTISFTGNPAIEGERLRVSGINRSNAFDEGDYINIRGTLYLITAESGSTLDCLPARMPRLGTGQNIQYLNPTVQARLAEGSVATIETPGFAGGWVLPWVEA